MIINYLPYIFGTVALFGGIYLFILSFKLYYPKFKTSEQKEKHDNWLSKFGTIGKICSVLLILNGVYDLIMRDPNRYKIGNKSTIREWTNEDKLSMINGCMRDAKSTAIKYPELTHNYCECAISKIMDSLSYEDYMAILKDTEQNQSVLLMPIIQECLNEFKQQIDSIEGKNN